MLKDAAQKICGAGDPKRSSEQDDVLSCPGDAPTNAKSCKPEGPQDLTARSFHR